MVQVEPWRLSAFEEIREGKGEFSKTKNKQKNQKRQNKAIREAEVSSRQREVFPKA